MAAQQAVGHVPRGRDFRLFDGHNEDVDVWLFQLSQFCSLRAESDPIWSDPAYCRKYAVTLLEGAAASW